MWIYIYSNRAWCGLCALCLIRATKLTVYYEYLNSNCEKGRGQGRAGGGVALVGVMLSRNVSKNHYGFVAITNAKLLLLLLLLLGGNLGNQRKGGGGGVLKCICNCIYRYSTAVQSCICICICKCNQICNGHLASQASVALSVSLSVRSFIRPDNLTAIMWHMDGTFMYS